MYIHIYTFPSQYYSLLFPYQCCLWSVLKYISFSLDASPSSVTGPGVHLHRAAQQESWITSCKSWPGLSTSFFPDWEFFSPIPNWSNWQVAKLLELPILEEYLNNLRNKEEFLNIDLTTQVRWETVANDFCLKLFHWQMIETIGRQLEDVVLGQRLFSDIEVCKNWPNCSTVIFIQILLLDSQSISFLSLFLEMIFLQFALDDGVVHAHKPLLMARCDMMQVSDTMYNLPICQKFVLKQLISGDVFWQFPRKLRPLCSLPWSHLCHFHQPSSLSLHRSEIVLHISYVHIFFDVTLNGVPPLMINWG